MPEDPLPGRPAPSRIHGSAADRVGSILAAAEATAEQLRRDTEERMRERIAEADRAARYRVDAADQEVAELLAQAREEAERLTRESRQRDEAARAGATSEALEIIGRAQVSADETLAEAAEAAARNRAEAERRSRELLSDARATAEAVRSEGIELVGNLRQMGDSLRANAERLLRDVQSLHSQMISRIEVVEASRQTSLAEGPPIDAPTQATAPDGGEVPDVPEFIPRR